MELAGKRMAPETECPKDWIVPAGSIFNLGQLAEKLLDFRSGRRRLGWLGLGLIIGADALDAFLKPFDSFSQAFAQTGKLTRSKDQKGYDQNHYQMPGL